MVDCAATQGGAVADYTPEKKRHGCGEDCGVWNIEYALHALFEVFDRLT